ncbi:putative glyoxalase superfamily protein PhnB [Nocardia tenerifensis]|uniref:Putative glyoxalase superfamily protein PhnB n=1 Tax=Nocardia tenerifensis TaxID=228006 RepID=A0A318JQW4_9NOCA|nr:VOC family protein [Nocardia tenerifensis]PXX56586.1 putative glyoxalase superfamily protein PhnB [Nocardia tenerifensis]
MSNGKDLALTHVGVLVGDHDQALEFYRDTLGLEVRQDMPFAGGRWLTVGPANQPGIEFVLETPAMVPDEAARALAESRLKDGAAGLLIFTVQSADDTFARLRDANVEVTQEPITQPYGVRDCGFRDPWGNHLRFSEVQG